MAQPNWLYVCPPSLLPTKKIGDKITTSELQNMCRYSAACQQLRTGFGFIDTTLYNFTSLTTKTLYTLLPSTGFLGFAEYSYSTALVAIYSSTTASISGTSNTLGVFNGNLTSFICYNRFIGPAMLRSGGRQYLTVTPNRRRTTSEITTISDPEERGGFGEHPYIALYDVYLPNYVSCLSPGLLELFEEAAQNSAYTPQLCGAIPYTNTTSYYRIVDPWREFMFIARNFCATIYLQRSALQRGELFIYVAMMRGGGYNSNVNIKNIHCIISGTEIALKEVYLNGSYVLGAARIPGNTTGEYTDYVRRNVRLKFITGLGGWPEDSSLATINSWNNGTTSFSITSSQQIGRSVWVAGRSTNKWLDMSDVV